MLTKSEAKLLHALKSRSGREKHSAFTVEGVRVLEELITAGIDLKFAVVSPTLEDSARGRALAEALAARTTVRRVREAELRELADTDTPQGVIAAARVPQHDLARVKLSEQAIVVVLDAIQDPGNLGTLIRSADAFAVACVLALPGTVDYWNPKVVRSAAGAAFRVSLTSAIADDAWRWLTVNQFIVCGADTRGDDIERAQLTGRVAIVVGNEGSGLRNETRKHVDRLLSIPMQGRAESLNVAAAAAILLYELSRSNR